MTKDELIQLLKTKDVLVEFTKKDGTKRKMLCTLKEDVIPEIVGTSVRKEGLITVFDLEKDAWRNINLTDWNVINAG
jgi:dihydrodipicolinate reductase